MNPWSRLADWVLAHPRLILIVSTLLTLFLGYWMFQVKTNHTAGHFLSTDSEEYRNFARLSEVFGQSQTILYVVFPDAPPTDPAFLRALRELTDEITGYPGVDYVLSLANAPVLVREQNRLVTRPLLPAGLAPDSAAQRLRRQPFLRELLVSDDGSTSVMLVKIEERFNDTGARVGLVDRIEAAAVRTSPRAALAGFPYLRTQYTKRVTAESPLFTVIAFLLSLGLLYAAFRALRVVLMPAVVVLLGVIWTIGLIALFGHQLNIVTAILPGLIVIIGMASSIHISTKFYDEYARTEDFVGSLHTTIRVIGQATFYTCTTTAVGFAVLVLSGSHHLAVFGEFASAGVMLLYVLAITIIPAGFLLLRPPARVAAPVTHSAFGDFFGRLAEFTRRHSTAILAATVALAVLGVVGVGRIPSDIYVFSDFRPDDPVRRNVRSFEKAFGGVLPMEIVIEADRPGGFRSLANLRRLERLQQRADSIPEVGHVLAVTDFAKLANQAYFGGHPRAYRLPTPMELPFLRTALEGLAATRRGGAPLPNLPRFVDSTFTVTRVFLGVPDLGTERTLALADSVGGLARELFPPDRFDVVVTGSAITASHSSGNLVNNLIGSLAAALVLISGLMALLSRSLRLTVISLVPNVLPLLLVGGAMGFMGIPLKPSTALVFSLAFGIAVDDTIHFLTKYRLLRKTGLAHEETIHRTMEETGKAILFMSFVLMGGFLVFTLSGFGGTAALGGFTALTLAIALVANLLLLPALLYRYGK